MKSFALKKIIFVGFIILTLGMLSLKTTWAHANYVRSDPLANSSLAAGQPPAKIQVWFSEGLEPKFSELQVLNNQRQRIDNADSKVLPDTPQAMVVTLKPGLPDGAYTVIYKTTSIEDGHVVKNSFAFVVGAGPLPTPEAINQADIASEADDNFNFWGVLLRWLNYLGAATLIGGVAWWLLVWQPSLRKVSERIGPEQAAADAVSRRRGTLLLTLALVLLWVGWLGWLLYQGTRFSGVTFWELLGSPAFGDLLFGSRFGIVWLGRLVILVAATIILLFITGRISLSGTGLPRRARLNLVPEVDPPAPRTVPAGLEADTTHSVATNGLGSAAKAANSGYWLLLVGGALLMFTTLFNAHATLESAWLLVPAHWLHLMSTGFWVGGLFYMALALPPALAALRPGTGDRTRLLAALIPNFSIIGIISVAILLTTGTVQAAIHLGAVSDFFDTNYGIALFIKLLVVTVLLLFGAYHLLRVSPALKGFAKRKSEKNGAGSVAAGQLQLNFRRSVQIEALIAIVLLVIVSSLLSFGPPNGAAKSGLVLRGQAADLSYVLQVNPGELGNNNFSLNLTQSDNQPLTKANAVLLRLNMTDMDMGTQQIELKPVANLPGHYQAQGQVLSMSGQWRAELLVQRDGKDDATAPILFKIK